MKNQPLQATSGVIFLAFVFLVPSTAPAASRVGIQDSSIQSPTSIVEQFYSTNVNRRSFISNLSQQRSQVAAEALLRLALDNRNATHREWAARNFVRTESGRVKALRLCDSEDSKVQLVGLLAVPKSEIHDTDIGHLLRSAASRDYLVRKAVLSLISDPATNLPAHARASVVIRAIETIDRLNAPEKMVHTHLGTLWNQRGFVFEEAVRALYCAKGLDLVALQPKNHGFSRDVFLIARGWRGDLSVKSSLSAIIQETRDPKLRELALRSWIVGKIGDPKDRNFLQRIERSDPYSCSSVTENTVVTPPHEKWPIRELAAEILSKMRPE